MFWKADWKHWRITFQKICSGVFDRFTVCTASAAEEKGTRRKKRTVVGNIHGRHNFAIPLGDLQIPILQ
jgi:hypothetical protein